MCSDVGTRRQGSNVWHHLTSLESKGGTCTCKLQSHCRTTGPIAPLQWPATPRHRYAGTPAPATKPPAPGCLANLPPGYPDLAISLLQSLPPTLQTLLYNYGGGSRGRKLTRHDVDPNIPPHMQLVEWVTFGTAAVEHTRHVAVARSLLPPKMLSACSGLTHRPSAFALGLKAVRQVLLHPVLQIVVPAGCHQKFL